MSIRSCDCSLIIPTRDRGIVLDRTLARISSLPDRNFETIVVDNGSTRGISKLVRRYAHFRWIRLGCNLAASARNVAAAAARGRFLFMLDDDSWPEPGVVDRAVALLDGRTDLGAVACRVRLADMPHRHDAGGVPGVFFNCGAVIRKSAFVEVGGFPIDYQYYVEEYDLCCRLWRRGWRVEPRGELAVRHARVAANRDNNRMLRLLIRNNLRLWQRYAPDDRREALVADAVDRYRRIAEKEGGLEGFHAGLSEGRADIAAGRIRRLPLSEIQLAHLFGLTQARRYIREWADKNAIRIVAVWKRGKGCEQLISTLDSLGIEVAAVYDRLTTVDKDEHWRQIQLRDETAFEPDSVDGILVGSLSPGVADDLLRDLSQSFAPLPVLSAAPWIDERRRRAVA